MKHSVSAKCGPAGPGVRKTDALRETNHGAGFHGREPDSKPWNSIHGGSTDPNPWRLAPSEVTARVVGRRVFAGRGVAGPRVVAVAGDGVALFRVAPTGIAVRKLALWLAVLTLVPMAVLAQEASGYARLRAQHGGECIAWQDRAFVYTVDAAGSEQVPGEGEFAAIDASFATWQAAAEACSDLTFTRATATADATIGYDEESTSNANVLLFRETRCRDVVPAGDPCVDAGNCSNTYRCWNRGDFTIALTLTSYTSPGGVILDSDIELNASPRLDGTRFFFTTVDAPACDPAEPHADCVANDVQNTVTHEVGHALGLDHAEVVGSTMEATAPAGETSKRILDPGTRRGLCEIYPRSRPSPSCVADARNDDQVVVLGRGTPGLPTFGCGTAASGPVLWIGTLLLASAVFVLRRRRSAPVRSVKLDPRGRRRAELRARP